MNDPAPAEVFPAGEFIRDELDERGWTQDDLARIMDRPVSHVQMIISGNRGITATTAHELSEAFGTSPEVWMNLDAAYRLWSSRPQRGTIRDRARIFEYAPVLEMQRRGWIKHTSDVDELAGELKRFFRVDSLDDKPMFAVAARSSLRDDQALTAEQTAWCCRALQLAPLVEAAQFTAGAFDEGCRRLRALLAVAEGVREVPRVLSTMGIRFVVVKHLARARIDGAALWLDQNSPVIALSLRYDRIDCFWHTLCHELSHIRNKDGARVDEEIVREGKLQEVPRSDLEQRADREAADMLLASEKLHDFILRVKPYYKKQRIIQFANMNCVHPGIVAGQLQFRGEIDYSANREMLVKVRSIVVRTALTDGWGQAIQGL